MKPSPVLANGKQTRTSKASLCWFRHNLAWFGYSNAISYARGWPWMHQKMHRESYTQIAAHQSHSSLNLDMKLSSGNTDPVEDSFPRGAVGRHIPHIVLDVTNCYKSNTNANTNALWVTHLLSRATLLSRTQLSCSWTHSAVLCNSATRPAEGGGLRLR